MRWSLTLSWYNFFILYLLRNQNERTDTLLRHEQDMLIDVSDNKVQHCMMQILHSKMLCKSIQTALMTLANILNSVLVQDQDLFDEITDLEQMWVKTEVRDELYDELCQAIQEQQRIFSIILRVRVFITECFLSNKEKLLFCERCWVLISESLHTELIQYTHDLTMTEHSERNMTDILLLRQFFWPEML